MKPFLIFFFLPLVLASLQSGCSYEKRKGEASSERGGGQIRGHEGGRPEVRGTAGLAQIQEKILGPKCVQCHSEQSGNQGGANLENYQNIKNLAARIEDRAIIQRNMPPGSPLSEAEIAVLDDWIKKGMPLSGNTPTPPPPPPTDQLQKITWKDVQEKIFQAHCLDCHGPSDPEGQLDLTSLLKVREKMPAIFAQAVILERMPLSPYEPLTAKEKKLLSDWIVGGMPE